MEAVMQNFIAELNIKRFRQLLATEREGDRRAWLVSALADEEAKLDHQPARNLDGDRPGR
jgi:hypothetical protein